MKRTFLYDGETLAEKVADARWWIEEQERLAVRHLELRLRGRAGAQMNPPDTARLRAALTMLDDVTAERDALRVRLDVVTWGSLSLKDRMVFAWLRQHGPSATGAAADALGMSRTNLNNFTKRLTAVGLVDQPEHGMWRAKPGVLATLTGEVTVG